MIGRPLQSGPATRRRRSTAFTLTELLVVIGLIAVIAGITAVSVRALAREAKVSSAVNTVSAALDHGRALAIRRNQIVLVVFRPRLDGRDQFVEIITAEWTGQSYFNPTDPFPYEAGMTIDRFRPIPGVAYRSLPRGIKVAAPFHVANPDVDGDVWVTQSHLPTVTGNDEYPGVILGVMYGPDGTVIRFNPRTEGDVFWLDLTVDPDAPQAPCFFWDGDCLDPTLSGDIDFSVLDEDLNPWYRHRRPNDEPFIVLADSLAVYSDERARDEFDPNLWIDPAVYFEELTGPEGYITANAQLIYFNRYTGVAMR